MEWTLVCSSLTMFGLVGLVKHPFFSSSFVKRMARNPWAKAVGVVLLSTAATLQRSIPCTQTLFPDCRSPNQHPEGK